MTVWSSFQLLLRPLQAGLLISFFFLTLNSKELLPEILLPLQFLFLLLLLCFEVFFIVQMPLLLGLLHLLTVHCTQSIQQRKDLTRQSPVSIGVFLHSLRACLLRATGINTDYKTRSHS